MHILLAQYNKENYYTESENQLAKRRKENLLFDCNFCDCFRVMHIQDIQNVEIKWMYILCCNYNHERLTFVK